MKFHTNVAKAGFWLSLLFTTGSFIRYYIIWPDPSQAIITSLIGLIGISISFLYDRQREMKGTFEKEKEDTFNMGSEVNQQAQDIKKIKEKLDIDYGG